MMTPVLLLLAALAVAVLAGVTLARLLRRRHPDGPKDGAGREWINVEDLTAPAVTLVALLLAFMLVQTYGSYQRAESHAAEEAALVDAEYQAAGLLAGPQRDDLRADLVCYARSVTALEWRTMTDREPDPVVEGWRDALQTDVARSAHADPERLTLSNIVELQSDLTTTRDERIAETHPAIPSEMTLLIEVAALLVLMLLIGYTWHLHRLPRFTLIASVAVLFLLLVGGIRELDTPFSGAIHIPPDRMHDTIERIEAPSAGSSVPAMPCDADGHPTA